MSSSQLPTELAPRKVNPPKAEVLDVALALTTYGETIAWMDETIERDERGYICVAATHTVMACREDAELRRAVTHSSMTVPDGQPLVWALRLLGHRRHGRVYGPGLMDLHCAHAARTQIPIYLYGGRNLLALDRLAQRLLYRYPGLKIVGGWSPSFGEMSEEENDKIAKEINDSGAKVVWVGIGVPKQEKWMVSMRDRLDAPVLVGVGAAFDFHAGLVSQAPSWIQVAGLEWLYRLSQEPRRLWRRYTRYNPLFIAKFGAQLYRHWRNPNIHNGDSITAER